MRRRDPHTRDLFASPEPVAVGFGEDVVGRGSLASKITRVVSRAMQDARDDDGVSRARLAEAMSEALGRPVSEDTLDKWASEAADDRRIPLDAFVALIAATKGYEALGFVPSLFGYAVVEGHYVELIELQQVRAHKEVLSAREAVLEAKAKARR